MACVQDNETVTDLSAAPTGGRATIGGVLYQMIRSLAVGCHVVAHRVTSGDHSIEALLVIEPASGDLRATSRLTMVEQIKMRRGKAPWSAGAIAEGVFPDLMRAVADTEADNCAFRFTTDRDEGLSELRAFLTAVQRKPVADSAMLDDILQDLSYGKKPVTARGFFLKVAKRAQADDVASQSLLWRLLLDLEIVTISETTLVAEIDALLRVLADNDDRIATLRAKLILDLVGVARTGGTVAVTHLLESNGLDPKRLLHVHRLSRILAERLEGDVRALQYREVEDIRTWTMIADAPVSILSGQSGQGKTWALCKAAMAAAGKGRPVVALPARGTVASLEAEIVKRVWLPSYAEAAPLVTVARRLRPRLGDDDGFWLTVFLDDLHDRDLARALIGAGWGDLGIRLVVSAQPMTETLLQQSWDVATYAVQDFSLAELRRYLASAGRDYTRVPDDVVELLRRPILTSTFVRLPETISWSDPNEYRLIEDYWHFASARYRDQPQHVSDAEALKALAATLLGERPDYPFPTRLRARHLTDDAVQRLVMVGLVHETESGLAFSHDRFLNWAIATVVADRFQDGELAVASLAECAERMETLRTVKGDPLGNRLGYVLLDVVWLLAQSADPAALAEFLLLHVRRATKRIEEEGFLAKDLATVGPSIVPALKVMLCDALGGPNEWIWRSYLTRALRRIGRGARDVVRQALVPLLDSEQSSERIAALNVLRAVPAPDAADRLFDIHLDHIRGLERKDGIFAERYAHYQASGAALRAAVKARPQWLADRAARTEAVDELDALLWQLLALEHSVALPQWQALKPRFIKHLGTDARVIVRAIGHFLDQDEIDRLEAPIDDPQGVAYAEQMHSLVRLDVNRAVRRLEAIDLESLSGTSHWWIDGLFHRAGEAVRAGLRPRARVKRDPIALLRDLYHRRIELLDAGTLDLVLDELERKLAKTPDKGADPLQQVWRLLDFVCDIPTAELIDCVHRRRGTALERLLCERAKSRPGRTSRYVDRFGDDARHVLAMMAGEGYDALALAELRRSERQGQEDGLLTALWTDDEAVGDQLERFPPPEKEDKYREVLLHRALAAHRRDAALESLVASDAPIMLNVLAIRHARAPMNDENVAVYRDALRSGNVENAKHAARMSAFAGRADLFAELVEAVLREDMGTELMDEAIGVFRHNGIYDPRLLPLVEPRLHEEKKASFAADYLATHGDAAARVVVGTWLDGRPEQILQDSKLSILKKLLDHHDSETRALAFIHARMRGPGWRRHPELTLRLAATGDVVAVEAVHSRAFQSPLFGDEHPIHAIRFLGKSDPEAAFAAAERLFTRHQEFAAAREMLRFDGAGAVPILLAVYRDAPWSLRWWIARLLRWHAPQPLYDETLAAYAGSEEEVERREAAELAGWLPSAHPSRFLAQLVDDPVRDVEMAALAGLRRRRMEAAGLALMEQLQGAPRPLAWARLRAIIRLVDPHVLSHGDDPACIAPVLDLLPPEFEIEAESRLEGARKKVDKEAKKRDKDRDFD